VVMKEILDCRFISHEDSSQRMFVECKLARISSLLVKISDMYVQSITGMAQQLGWSSIIR